MENVILPENVTKKFNKPEERETIVHCLRFINEKFTGEKFSEAKNLFFLILDNIALLSEKDRSSNLKHLLDKTGLFGLGKVRLECILTVNPNLLELILKFANDCKIYLVHLHSFIRDLNKDKFAAGPTNTLIVWWETKEISLILKYWLILKDSKSKIINPNINSNYIYINYTAYELAEIIYSLKKLNSRLIVYKLVETRLNEMEEYLNEKYPGQPNIISTSIKGILLENYHNMSNEDIRTLTHINDNMLEELKKVIYNEKNSEVLKILACDKDFLNEVFKLRADQGEFYPNLIEDIKNMLEKKTKEKNKEIKKSIDDRMRESKKKSREQSSDSSVSSLGNNDIVSEK